MNTLATDWKCKNCGGELEFNNCDTIKINNQFQSVYVCKKCGCLHSTNNFQPLNNNGQCLFMERGQLVKKQTKGRIKCIINK